MRPNPEVRNLLTYVIQGKDPMLIFENQVMIMFKMQSASLHFVS